MAENPPNGQFKLRRSNQNLKRQEQTAANRRAAREKAGRIILAVVNHVSATRGIPWSEILDKERCSDRGTAARTFCMGLAIRLEAPTHLVAKAFMRHWTTARLARIRCAELCAMDPTLLREWDDAVTILSPPANPSPEAPQP